MADAGADSLLRCPRCHSENFSSPRGRDMHYARWCPLLPHWQPTRYPLSQRRGRISGRGAVSGSVHRLVARSCETSLS